MENQIVPHNRLQIRFGSESHEIDLRTLAAMLEANEKLLNRIVSYYYKQEVELNFRVSPPMEGSFVIDLWLKAKGGSLKRNARETLSITADVLGIVAFLWMCFAQSNGEPLRSGPERDAAIAEIESQLPPNSPVSPATVINIYNYGPVRTAMTRAVTTAAGETVIETIEITAGDEPTFVIDKEKMEEVKKISENTIRRENIHEIFEQEAAERVIPEKKYAERIEALRDIHIEPDLIDDDPNGRYQQALKMGLLKPNEVKKLLSE